jgi:hypothetical protein
MSGHLRHCPKHRKTLPCPHCALAAKPAPEPVVVIPSASALRAKKWRAEQKQSNPEFAEQEAKRKAGERAETDRIAQIEEIVRSNPTPLFVMTDAEQGKGLLVTGGYDSAKLAIISRPKSTRVKPSGYGAKDFEKNDGVESGTKKIGATTETEFAPKFPPDKERRILRQYVCDNTKSKKTGELVCALCEQAIGDGRPRPDFTDRLEVGILHIEQHHREQFQVFLKRLADPEACHQDHEGMVRRHGHGARPVKCGKCKKTLWKPPRVKKPEKPRSDKVVHPVSETAA